MGIINIHKETGRTILPTSKFTVYVITGLAMAMLAACASDPTSADLMRQYSAAENAQAELKNQLTEDWEAGAELVASGEKRIKEARRAIKKANKDIERGDEEIEAGKKMMEKSEDLYRKQFPGSVSGFD